jgi:arginine repressor
MNNKKERRMALQKIIRENDITNVKEVYPLLIDRGIPPVHPWTIYQDLSELGIHMVYRQFPKEEKTIKRRQIIWD